MLPGPLEAPGDSDDLPRGRYTTHDAQDSVGLAGHVFNRRRRDIRALLLNHAQEVRDFLARRRTVGGLLVSSPELVDNGLRGTVRQTHFSELIDQRSDLLVRADEVIQ